MFGTQLQDCVRRENARSGSEGIEGGRGDMGEGGGAEGAGTRIGGSLLSLTVYDIEKIVH